MKEVITRAFDESVRVKQAFLRDSIDDIVQAVDAVVTAFNNGNKLLIFGNGGSAADAQHLATELSVRYRADRKALPAIALSADGVLLTAAGNDLGFELVFSRQIEALGRPGDLAIALSTSGKSPNVIAGLRAARAAGLSTAAFGGGKGGVLPALADPVLLVPSDQISRIQEMHITLGHMLCAALERELGFSES